MIREHQLRYGETRIGWSNRSGRTGWTCRGGHQYGLPRNLLQISHLAHAVFTGVWSGGRRATTVAPAEPAHAEMVTESAYRGALLRRAPASLVTSRVFTKRKVPVLGIRPAARRRGPRESRYEIVVIGGRGSSGRAGQEAS